MFPERDPQAEFASAEENSGFQGISADGIRLFLPLSQLVETLISKKGADFVDTLRCRIPTSAFLLVLPVIKRKNACRGGDYAIYKRSKIHANRKPWRWISNV